MTFSLVRVFADQGVGEDALKPLKRAVREREYAPGSDLIRQGEAADSLFFLTQGVAKMHYLTADGREFVKSFVAEGDFAGSLMAYMEDGASPFSITCLEPVVAEFVPFKVVYEMFLADPVAMAFGMRFFQALALKKERREYSFLCLAPEERYRWFVDENPALAKRLTQADIARYLGITPVALSRIRGRMKAR